ncbi:MAG TPA: hypothetical protein VFI42_00510 [Thermomicrobiaceae bacterium]|nr:hypothetical protein [Thermomicrobiaceae bacterium]
MRFSSRSTLRTLPVVALVLSFAAVPATAAAALTAADPSFSHVWQLTDQPVVDGVSRSWMWGPRADTPGIEERYLESPGGERLVQYFDKGRMEVNDPQADPNGEWYVTSGLLDRELISGKIQVGDNRYLDTGAGAPIPVAGDPSNPFPTYADLQRVIDRSQPDRTGNSATLVLTPTGQADRPEATTDPNAQFVHYARYIGPTGRPVGYNIPRAFWDYMNQAGPVDDGGTTHQAAPLFDWLFTLGWPIADPFWAQVSLAGTSQWVLVQPFERRLLTYTPSNPAGWKVEMGNIGLHYERWRYAQTPPVQLSGDQAFLAMQQGNQWSYSTSAGETELWRATGISRSFLGGSALATRQESGPMGSRNTYWSITPNGMDLDGYDQYDAGGKLSDTVVYWPPLHYLPAASPYVGDAWSTVSTAISTTGPPRRVTLSVQVTSYERVSTPAGIFTSWKLTIVQWDNTDPAHPKQNVTTLWFAPNIGTVGWLTASFAAQLQALTILPPG